MCGCSKKIKKMKAYSYLLLAVLGFAGFACKPAQTPSTIGTTSEVEARVESILSQMTLSEKIGQMTQVSAGGDVSNYADALRKGQIGSILNEVDPVKINEYQRMCMEESRLGIPLLVARDVIHGYHTVFPIPLGLAATFDPALVEEGARVVEDYERVDQLAHEFGSQLNDPFMTLSFMALLVIPELKLSDKGLFDVARFDFTTLTMD